MNDGCLTNHPPTHTHTYIYIYIYIHQNTKFQKRGIDGFTSIQITKNTTRLYIYKEEVDKQRYEMWRIFIFWRKIFWPQNRFVKDLLVS